MHICKYNKSVRYKIGLENATKHVAVELLKSFPGRVQYRHSTEERLKLELLVTQDYRLVMSGVKWRRYRYSNPLYNVI